MRISEKFILLGWGAFVGGVVAPIYTTDLTNYRRIIAAVTEGAEFDWGSFLGGAVAGSIALVLFLVQRSFDTEKARRSVQAKYFPSLETADTFVKSINIVLEEYISFRDQNISRGISLSQKEQFHNLFCLMKGEIEVSMKRLKFFDKIDHTGCSTRFFEAKEAMQHLLFCAADDYNSAWEKYCKAGGVSGASAASISSIFHNELRAIFKHYLKLSKQPLKMIEDIELTIERQLP
ncbi:hypothetical protein TH8_21690 [Thalassospira profundimaris]|nr:hypothetical protein TH8_21690 [Thalassospira profundimaris]